MPYITRKVIIRITEDDTPSRGFCCSLWGKLYLPRKSDLESHFGSKAYSAQRAVCLVHCLLTLFHTYEDLQEDLCAEVLLGTALQLQSQSSRSESAGKVP